MTRSRMIVNKVLLLFCLYCLMKFCYGIDFRPNCGFPGKPFGSKMAPAEKSLYSEGDTVQYTCRDYWLPPQSRTCSKGQWSGPVARCADNVRRLQVRDVECHDLSTGSKVSMFNYKNITLYNMDSKYAFLAKSFKDGKLFLKNDHEYIWNFNLSRSATKLYVTINYHFINFTELSEEIKIAHRFSIEINISPYRVCVMEHQTWRKTLNRIDTYFICQFRSLIDVREELKSPPAYLKVKTRSSHNISYEFSALLFGKVYGTEELPICGEPERMIGEIVKINKENNNYNYIIECDKSKNWIEERISKNSLKGVPHIQRCIGDMNWNGTRPICVPTKYCSLEGSEVFTKIKQLINSNNNKIVYRIAPRNEKILKANHKNNNHKKSLIVDSFINYFHSIDDKIFAIIDSELTYSCDSDDLILVGQESRKCRDGKWSGTEPICKSLSSSQLIIIIFGLIGILLILLPLLGIIFYQYTKRIKRRVKKAQTKQNSNDARNAAVLSNECNIIKKLDYIVPESIYELYEHINEPTRNHYTDTSYNRNETPDVEQYCNNIVQKQTIQNIFSDESDYVQMHRQKSIPNDSYESLVSIDSKQPTKLVISEEDDYLDLSRGTKLFH